MRRADGPDTRKRLTRRSELDKENSRVEGASTHEDLGEIHANDRPGRVS